MDLTKAKFEIITIPSYSVIDYDTIDFFKIIPDPEHLLQMGSGQFTIEEGQSFACDSQEALDTYEDLLDKYEEEEEQTMEDLAQLLEAEGLTNLGSLTSVMFLKKVKNPPEYLLCLRINDTQVIMLATGYNKRTLSQYKKLIDNKVIKFKIGLMIQQNPEYLTSLEEIYSSVEEMKQEAKDSLEQAGLT